MKFLRKSNLRNVLFLVLITFFLPIFFLKNSVQSLNQTFEVESEECVVVNKEIEISLPKQYKYDLSIVAIFQNESLFLKEWIEFHKLVGVQHFYLYNNLSTDNYYEILSPYLKSGEVDLIDWPCNYPAGNKKFWCQVQIKSYINALNRAKGETKWLAIIDMDEFLVPVKDNNLVNFLSAYENDNIGGVGVNWQMFGTSFVPMIPEKKLLIETLVLKTDPNNSINRYVKTIVRPERVERPSIHSCIYKNHFIAVNSDGKLTKGSFQDILIEKIVINHYWTRDQYFFQINKIPSREKRGRTVDFDFYEKNFNQQQDFTMSRFVTDLRKAMGFEE